MSAPEGQSERTGVLVIRASIEPERETLRAGITQIVDLAAPEEIVSVAASEEPILDEVGKWLRAVQASKP
jgi:hypothetical protein